MPFCTQCGSRNPDDANFCATCGSRLVKPERLQSSDPESAAEPAAEMDAADGTVQEDSVEEPAEAVTEEPVDAPDEVVADAPDVEAEQAPEPEPEPGPFADEQINGTSTPAVDATATVTFGVPSTTETREAPGSGAQASLDDDDAAAVDALPQGNALLVVQRGPGAGNRFLLDQDVVTAGRHPESEIFLDDITVSRRHVEFRRTPDGFRVADVGSLNGTYVNRDRIDDAALQNGDEVQIGKFRLVYFTGDVPADR